jgi:enolase
MTIIKVAGREILDSRGNPTVARFSDALRMGVELFHTLRIAKYNQLLRIEEDLGGAARFPGRKAFRQ